MDFMRVSDKFSMIANLHDALEVENQSKKERVKKKGGLPSLFTMLFHAVCSYTILVKST